AATPAALERVRSSSRQVGLLLAPPFRPFYRTVVIRDAASRRGRGIGLPRLARVWPVLGARALSRVGGRRPIARDVACGRRLFVVALAEQGLGWIHRRSGTALVLPPVDRFEH